MDGLKHKILVHVIREDNDDVNPFYRYVTFFPPRVGDEIRIKDREFYTVMSVVWCLDEQEHFNTRLNIGVEPIKGG